MLVVNAEERGKENASLQHVSDVGRQRMDLALLSVLMESETALE